MKRHRVVVYRVGREINTPALLGWRRKRFPEDPVTLEVNGKAVYVFSFGCIALVDPGEGMPDRAVEMVAPYVRRRAPLDSEEYEVLVAETEGEFRQAGGRRPPLHVGDTACIVMGGGDGVFRTVAYALAQSLALDLLEAEVEEALEKARGILPRLERGWLLRGRSVLGELVTSLRVRIDALSDIMILDKPELVWEDPLLDRLYEGLRRVFELEERFRSLEKSLDTIQEIGVLASDLVAATREELLELLILFLILVELLLSLTWILKGG